MNKKKEPEEIMPIKQWWAILVSGIVSMAAGAAVIILDFQDFDTPVLYFGACIVVTGFSHLVVSIASNNPVINKASVFFVSFFRHCSWRNDNGKFVFRAFCAILFRCLDALSRYIGHRFWKRFK
jgi:hypothetical protein